MNFDQLSYRYRRGHTDVVRNVSWQVPRGRTILLGPNGAGKSTLLALAAGALSASRGRCVIMDQDTAPRPSKTYRAMVGWMPQTVRPVRGLRVQEQVAFCGWLNGLTRATAATRAVETLKLVDLFEQRDRKSHELSGGQMRRLGLAEALVHQPCQLLLDEPTSGLDPAQRQRFMDIMLRLPEDVDVLLSTHQAEDLEDSYDSVAVMRDGCLQFTGTSRQFLAKAPEAAKNRVVAAYSVIVTEARPEDLHGLSAVERGPS